MDRTYIKANFKLSLRIRKHSQRSPWPAEATTISLSGWKCYTFSYQDRREHNWSITPVIYPNWKNKSDLTGQFPVQLDRGNNYILVAYHYDANNIFTTPPKNRTGPWILNGITKVCDKLRKRRLTPKFRIMDNEVPEDLKYFLQIPSYSYDWWHHICIREMLHKCLWEHSRNTLLPPYSQWALYSPSTYRTASYPKSPWHSICCGNTNWKLNYQPMNR